MDDKGGHNIFNTRAIKTYPIASRQNRVTCDDALGPEQIPTLKFELAPKRRNSIKTVAEHVIALRKRKRPVVLFAGANLIKNGLGSLLIDLTGQDLVTFPYFYQQLIKLHNSS